MKLQFLLYLFLFCAATGFSQQDTNMAEHYTPNGNNCAIFPASAVAFLPAKSRFTPTKRDVDKAEHALHTQLEKLNSGHINQGAHDPIITEKLKKYARQYFGYIDSAGHRILYINCIYMDEEYRQYFEKEFLKDMNDVMDGGSYFWNVKYDIDTDKLFDLQINGMG